VLVQQPVVEVEQPDTQVAAAVAAVVVADPQSERSVGHPSVVAPPISWQYDWFSPSTLRYSAA
jgi:hypothetical protein